VRLSATAGRAFAQVVQVERLARGLSTENGGQPLVPPEVERKSTEELRAYLVGVEDGSSDQWPAGEGSR
jgi:hypothetical protein